MNVRHLKTFLAIAEHGTFTAAGEAVGLSHSAVSLHVKAIEEELDVELVDRSSRPPTLTATGHALVEHARRMIDLLDDIAALGSQEGLVGSLNVGCVPSAMESLLPPALGSLRATQPRLAIRVRTGLSGDLATLVRSGDIDVAVATAPAGGVEFLRARVICAEPLFLIAPAGAVEQTVEEMVAAHPFVWFSRKTWAGQDIERHLLAQKISVRSNMELDSLPAVLAMVQNGMGVSVVPAQRSMVEGLPALRYLPFGEPQLTRQLAQLERPNNPRSLLADALYAALCNVKTNETDGIDGLNERN